MSHPNTKNKINPEQSMAHIFAAVIAELIPREGEQLEVLLTDVIERIWAKKDSDMKAFADEVVNHILHAIAYGMIAVNNNAQHQGMAETIDDIIGMSDVTRKH